MMPVNLVAPLQEIGRPSCRSGGRPANRLPANGIESLYCVPRFCAGGAIRVRPPQAAFHIDGPKGKLRGRQGLHALRCWSTHGSMLVAVGNILLVDPFWRTLPATAGEDHSISQVEGVAARSASLQPHERFAVCDILYGCLYAVGLHKALLLRLSSQGSVGCHSSRNARAYLQSSILVFSLKA